MMTMVMIARRRRIAMTMMMKLVMMVRNLMMQSEIVYKNGCHQNKKET